MQVTRHGEFLNGKIVGMGKKPSMPGKLNYSLVKLLVERAENEGIAAKAVAQRSGLSESTISRTFAGNRVMNVNEFEQIALARMPAATCGLLAL